MRKANDKVQIHGGPVVSRNEGLSHVLTKLKEKKNHFSLSSLISTLSPVPLVLGSKDFPRKSTI